MIKYTLTFFITSFACILLAMLLSGSVKSNYESESTDLSQTRVIPTALVSQASKIDIILTKKHHNSIFINFVFGDQEDIQIIYNKAMNLEKAKIDLVDDALTINLNNTLPKNDNNYSLSINVPRRDWTVNLAPNMLKWGKHGFQNEGEAINLTAELSDCLQTKGNFKRLNVWHIGRGDYEHNDCVEMNDTKIEQLDYYVNLPEFSITKNIGEVNLHSDKKGRVSVKNMLMLKKVNWFELTDVEKKKLKISAFKPENLEDNE